MAKSVQFKDAANVLTAYLSRAVPRFAIFQDKQFLFKYDGEDLDAGADALESWLDILAGSAAIYTVCVYEDPAVKINSKTPYDGSFNFRLQENTESYNQGSRAIADLRAEILEIKTAVLSGGAVAGPDDGPDDEPAAGSVESMLDQVNGVLGHPLVAQFLPAILGAIQGRPPAIAGAPDQSAGVFVAKPSGPGSVDIPADVLAAVGNIIAAVPNAEKKLVELGDIAVKDPRRIRKLWGYLDML